MNRVFHRLNYFVLCIFCLFFAIVLFFHRLALSLRFHFVLLFLCILIWCAIFNDLLLVRAYSAHCWWHRWRATTASDYKRRQNSVTVTTSRQTYEKKDPRRRVRPQRVFGLFSFCTFSKCFVRGVVSRHCRYCFVHVHFVSFRWISCCCCCCLLIRFFFLFVFRAVKCCPIVVAVIAIVIRLLLLQSFFFHDFLSSFCLCLAHEISKMHFNKIRCDFLECSRHFVVQSVPVFISHSLSLSISLSRLHFIYIVCARSFTHFCSLVCSFDSFNSIQLQYFCVCLCFFFVYFAFSCWKYIEISLKSNRLFRIFVVDIFIDCMIRFWTREPICVSVVCFCFFFFLLRAVCAVSTNAIPMAFADTRWMHMKSTTTATATDNRFNVRLWAHSMTNQSMWVAECEHRRAHSRSLTLTSIRCHCEQTQNDRSQTVCNAQIFICAKWNWVHFDSLTGRRTNRVYFKWFEFGFHNNSTAFFQ